MTIQFTKILRHSPKRGATMKRGLVQSPWIVKIENDNSGKPWRRVYEDWNRLDKCESTHPKDWAPVPLVLVIGGATVALTDAHRHQLEAHKED